MSEVYRARNLQAQRDVAIKILIPRDSTLPRDLRRFQREARILSALNHPNICTFCEVGRDGVIDYLVMEYVEGETLAQLLARAPLPSVDVLKIGGQIGDALDHAHRAGIIHRDLKPGNAVLTRNGVKLMDFGLAKVMSSHKDADVGVGAATPISGRLRSAEPTTAEGMCVGTVQYMAPEQLEGNSPDVRSDIWALGCVLYEMATRRRAFEGSAAATVISAILRSPPKAMAAPSMHPAFERAVLRCLAKHPKERWQTAAEIRGELLRISAAAGS